MLDEGVLKISLVDHGKLTDNAAIIGTLHLENYINISNGAKILYEYSKTIYFCIYLVCIHCNDLY